MDSHCCLLFIPIHNMCIEPGLFYYNHPNKKVSFLPRTHSFTHPIAEKGTMQCWWRRCTKTNPMFTPAIAQPNLFALLQLFHQFIIQTMIQKSKMPLQKTITTKWQFIVSWQVVDFLLLLLLDQVCVSFPALEHQSLSMASFLLTNAMVVRLCSIQAWLSVSAPLVTHSFVV